MSDDALDVLLIEDNPGDARLIVEMLREAEGLLERVDLGPATADGTRIDHEETLEEGLDHLSETAVDVILLDLDLPDSVGLDTLAAVVEATEFTPIVVLTGLRDEQVGIDSIQRGAQDYLVKDEVTSDLLVRTVHHAIERNRQERERVRRTEQLAALNRLNEISQDVTHAVITTSTREDLERAVCDRLVESDAYRFAWIGEVDRSTGRITPRVAAGVEEGYLDDVTITVDDEETAQGPAGQAARTHEVHAMQNVLTDPAFEPWREEARERGYRSSVAVPIVHEDVLYGLLNVYAASPNAFSEPETEIFSRIGDVIGHAIAAIERRDALMSDTVVELEFRAEGLLEEIVALTATGDGRIEFENLVSSGETLIAYGHAEDVPEERFVDLTADVDAIEDVRVLSAVGGQVRFELLTTAVSDLINSVASHGGRVESARIGDGEMRFVVEFPPGRDKRRLVELVEEHCPGATNIAQRTVERSEGGRSADHSVLEEQLTEKQRTALETAYYAGYFDWPRESTGEDVADRLGVTPATFTQHLRAAERRFFDAEFDGN